MLENILMVDDESNVLTAYEHLMHKDFKIDTAVGGAAALRALETKGPYAIVVSDMRMPDMDGVQLLTKVKQLAPDTVRIMLTGYADIQSAMGAVNEGSIFRFLTKPCEKETLAKTLTAGLLQYRLVNAERELLENTLQGSIQVLTEVLGMVNPVAFGRALRVRRYMHHLTTSLALPNPWRFEVAAMMSQLGCVTLHPETIEAVCAGRTLSPAEQARFDAHPMVARDLLSKIPRLEPVAWMIAHQNTDAPLGGDPADSQTADIRLGANLLRATLVFDELVGKGLSKSDAVERLSQQHKNFDPQIFPALRELELDPEKTQTVVRDCTVDELIPFGMILEQEVRTKAGLLLVAKGQEVTEALILRLKSFQEYGAIGRAVVLTVSTSGNQAKAATV
ncbi:MAG: HD domain-containing phosphohydrolase [Terriglobales bacterium]